MMIVKLLSVKYHSSITVVTFQKGEDSFSLYGDRRMTWMLEDYIGEEIEVFVTNEYTWNWKEKENICAEQ
jgi:hypothetical protein